MGCNLNLSKEALEINPYKESYPKAKTSKKQSLTEQTNKCTRSSQSGHDTRAPRSQATTHATHDDDGTEKKTNGTNGRQTIPKTIRQRNTRKHTHASTNKQTTTRSASASPDVQTYSLPPSHPPLSGAAKAHTADIGEGFFRTYVVK